MPLPPPCRAALAALICCALAACSSPRPNVVVVMIDTLRPDRLGAYGDGRGLTPVLDALAARSTVFANAYAQSSWTNPSVASLFTSRYQSQHRIISFGSVLADDEQTLAEILRQHGYATGAFSANFLVQPRLGFDQGFDVFKLLSRQGPPRFDGRPKIVKARAEQVTEAAFAWLDGRADARQPVFLYVHYMEPHAPYDPPPDAVARAIGDVLPATPLERVNTLMEVPIAEATAVEAAAVAAYYDAEVAALDASLQALFDGLGQRGLLDDALLVVLADHGEELFEHGRLGHHQTLYEEVIRIPLMIHAPGQTARRDVAAPVELVDLAPTILAWLGIARPQPFAGVSLAPDLPGYAAPLGARLRAWLAPAAALAPRAVYSELLKEPETLRLSQHERATVRDGQKAIAEVDGETAYYDLRRDPGETERDGVPAAARAVLAAGLNHLRALYAAAGGGAEGGTAELDDHTRERMRALGYAE